MQIVLENPKNYMAKRRPSGYIFVLLSGLLIQTFSAFRGEKIHLPVFSRNELLKKESAARVWEFSVSQYWNDLPPGLVSEISSPFVSVLFLSHKKSEISLENTSREQYS